MRVSVNTANDQCAGTLQEVCLCLYSDVFLRFQLLFHTMTTVVVTVYGGAQTNKFIYTHMHNAVSLVWGSPQ